MTFESDNSNVRVYAVPNDSKKPKIGSDQETLPSANYYSWKAATATNGGIGKLVIPGTASNLCVQCEINVAVESTIAETVDFFVRKKSAFSFIYLYLGRVYPINLFKDEAEKMYFNIQKNEREFSINVKVLKGSISIEYSTSSKFEPDQTHSF